MIKFLYTDELAQHPVLEASMFRDRAVQFKERLGWDVFVDERGYEMDQYDEEGPLYVIWQLPDGTHGGSMRILPTVGRTMVNDHFKHLNDGVEVVSPLIWECTRFCLSPNLPGGFRAIKPVSAALMMAGCELGIRFGLEHSIGTFDARMVRIYQSLGWTPEIIGSEGEGAQMVSLGLWPIDAEARATIAEKSGLSESMAAEWFDMSFPEMMDQSVGLIAAE